MQKKAYPLSKSAYGGSLLNTRAGRAKPRPLATGQSMHFVLRSSKAVGQWSFKRSQNEKKIREILAKFSAKHAVKIFRLAVVGNHLHLHLKISHVMNYQPFIRAVSGAIAMAVTGASRWKPLKAKEHFWDYRPFSRVIIGKREWENICRYIEINQLEGMGYSRDAARFTIAWNSS